LKQHPPTHPTTHPPTTSNLVQWICGAASKQQQNGFSSSIKLDPSSLLTPWWFSHLAAPAPSLLP